MSPLDHFIHFFFKKNVSSKVKVKHLCWLKLYDSIMDVKRRVKGLVKPPLPHYLGAVYQPLHSSYIFGGGLPTPPVGKPPPKMYMLYICKVLDFSPITRGIMWHDSKLYYHRVTLSYILSYNVIHHTHCAKAQS